MSLAAFIHEKPYEKIVAVIRPHPITFVATTVGFATLALMPLIFVQIMGFIFPEGISISEPLYAAAVPLGSAYYLMLIVFYFSAFTSYYLDVLIVTNERLIDVEQHTLFARTVSEMDMYQVQDITTEIKGMVASFFNYGNLLIQNASAVTKFQAHNVKDPQRLRQLILGLANQDRYQEEHGTRPLESMEESESSETTEVKKKDTPPETPKNAA